MSTRTPSIRTPAMDERLSKVPPVAKLLGRKIIDAAADGTVRLQFKASEKFANRFGTVQGGILSAMLDSALGISVLVTLPPGQFCVTVTLNTTYFRPAKPGPIHAQARVLHRSGKLAHAEADLHDEAGVRIARATASLRILGAAQ
jgi:uncharacterized protein (TIGR00369 family)